MLYILSKVQHPSFFSLTLNQPWDTSLNPLILEMNISKPSKLRGVLLPFPSGAILNSSRAPLDPAASHSTLQLSHQPYRDNKSLQAWISCPPSHLLLSVSIPLLPSWVRERGFSLQFPKLIYAQHSIPSCLFQVITPLVNLLTFFHKSTSLHLLISLREPICKYSTCFHLKKKKKKKLSVIPHSSLLTCLFFPSKLHWLSCLHLLISHSPKHGFCPYCFTEIALPKVTKSHTLVKQCSKFSKPGFNNTWTVNFQMFKLDLEKAEEPETKLPTSAGSSKKQESSRKTTISALLTTPKPLTVWITINCGKFWKRWEYQTTWPASWEICMQVRKQQLELDMEQKTSSV